VAQSAFKTAWLELPKSDFGRGYFWQHGIIGALAFDEIAKLICSQGIELAEEIAVKVQPKASDGMHQASKANSANATPQERCQFLMTAFCISALIIS
jgi:hypothetical protein